MASIICGHCKGIHDSVEDVRECAAFDFEPREVACRSCDSVMGYVAHDEIKHFSPYCGGQVCKRDFPASF